jgi:hypothetical protein
MCDRIASGGISTFGNLIVKSFGYSSFETILFNIPFGVIQIIAIIGSGWIATKTQRKGLVITGISVLPAIGTIIMLTVPRQHKGVLLFGYYLVSDDREVPVSRRGSMLIEAIRT